MRASFSKTAIPSLFAFAVLFMLSSTVSGQQVTQPFVVGTTVAGGPGTEMTQIINRIGLGSDCGRCKALAAEMDQNGADWVMRNKQYVVQRTISNAQNLGHRMGPIQRMGVRSIVTRAARRAR